MDSEKDRIIKEIEDFKQRLPFKVEKIIFFGSRAKGNYKKESDIDLIIVSDYFRNIRFNKRMPIMYDYWDMNYPVDFICYTPEEFEERSSKITIANTAQNEGVVV